MCVRAQELLHSEPLLVCVVAGVSATNHAVIESALRGWFGCVFPCERLYPLSQLPPAACASHSTPMHALSRQQRVEHVAHGVLQRPTQQ